MGGNTQVQKGLYVWCREEKTLGSWILPLALLGWARRERLPAGVGGWRASACATCLALVGGRGRKVLDLQQPQVKEQSSHSAVCPLVWDWTWIGPLGPHPSKGIGLCPVPLEGPMKLWGDVSQAPKCCGLVTE